MHCQCIQMHCTLQWLWDSERINQIKQQKMDEIFDKRLNMSANFNYKSSLISSLALNIKYRPFRNRIGLHCIAFHRNNTVNSMQLCILWNVLILTGNMHFTMWWSILGICNEFIIASHPELIALSLKSNSFSSFIPTPHPSIMDGFGKFSKTPKKQMNTHHIRRDFPVYMNFTLNIYFIFGTPVCLYIQWILFYFILFIWFVFCKIYLYMIYLLHFDVYI